MEEDLWCNMTFEPSFYVLLLILENRVGGLGGRVFVYPQKFKWQTQLRLCYIKLWLSSGFDNQESQSYRVELSLTDFIISESWILEGGTEYLHTEQDGMLCYATVPQSGQAATCWHCLQLSQVWVVEMG